MLKKSACFLLLSLMQTWAVAVPNAIQPNYRLGSQAFNSNQFSNWVNALPYSVTEKWTKYDSLSFFEQEFEVYALASIAPPNWSKDIKGLPLQTVLNREMADWWYQFHYVENMGYSLSDLEQVGNPSHIVDSLRKVNANPSIIRNELAANKFVTDERLKAYYQEHFKGWAKPQQYEIAAIVIDTAHTKNIRQALAQKVDFGEIATKYSLDSVSAANHGYLGWYYPGVDPGMLRPSIKWVYDTLFTLKEKTIGQIYERPPYSNKQEFIKVLQYRDKEYPPYDSVAALTRQQLLNSENLEIANRTLDSLIHRYGYHVLNLPYPAIEDFYKANPSRFQSPKAWYLHAIENSDSALLAQKIAKMDQKTSFDKLASKLNQNTFTKKINGKLGWFKQGMYLPYDFGDPTGFKAAIEKVQNPGLLTGVFFNPQRKTYVVFYVDSLRSAQLKPFDRVAKSVETILHQEYQSFPDTTPLVSYQGKTIIYESDVKAFYSQIPPRNRRSYTHDRVVEQLLKWDIYARDAQVNSADTNSVFKQRREMITNFLAAKVVRDSIERTMMQPQSKIDSLVKAKSELFKKLPMDPKIWAALYLEMPEYIFKLRAYRLADSLNQDLAQVQWAPQKDSIFVKSAMSEYMFAKMRVIWKIRADQKESLPIDQRIHPFQGTIAQNILRAKELAKGDNKKASVELLHNLIPLTWGQLGSDSLVMESARALIDANRLGEALSDLDYLDFLAPQSPLHANALFLKSYILMDLQKKEQAALRPLKRLIQLHPKDKLAQDADFLVRDIQSGHKLSEEMIKNLENNSSDKTGATQKQKP